MTEVLRAVLVRHDDGRLELRAPTVGLWREFPAAGSLVRAGSSLGRMEILGRLLELRAPDGAHGVLTALGGDPTLARRPVAYGDSLVTLNPSASSQAPSAEQTTQSQYDATGLVFRSPSSGRFYARPAPDKPLFVEVGDVVQAGQAIAILEVMKTFNRLLYGGDGMPARARVVRVVPADGDDLGAGDAILELEPAPSA